MNKVLEQEIRTRAGHRCEYCCLPEKFSRLPFTIDHIVAKQHGGLETSENLALACGFCNRHKGPNIAGIDPDTKLLVRLFNPRQDHWDEHFRWDRAQLLGLTAIGKATILVLSINHPYQTVVRQALMDEEVFFAM